MPAGSIPTVINGGIINAYGTNARLGGGDWMVVESDESDGSFLRLPAVIAVVTNVDPEHLDHYGTFDALRDAFVRFVENIPFYGFAVLCFDHPEVQALIPRVADRRIITYGLGANADVRAINLRARPQRRRFRRHGREPRHQRIARHQRPAPADVRPAQRAERAGRHRRGAGDGPRRRHHPPRAGLVRRRQAPLHQDRRGARHHRDRRLRPPSRRDRRRAAGRPPGLWRFGAGDRRHAAAPLYPPGLAQGRVRHLLLRCRRRADRRRLCRRRDADRRRQPRHAGEPGAPRRPSRCRAARAAPATCPA